MLLIAHLLDEDVDIETTPPGYAEPWRINVHNKELRVSRSVVIAIPVQHDAEMEKLEDLLREQTD
jgi:hypothetical protein